MKQRTGEYRCMLWLWLLPNGRNTLGLDRIQNDCIYSTCSTSSTIGAEAGHL